MKRREFITLLGGAAVAWPLAARAQQSAIPVIGSLHTDKGTEQFMDAFRQDLKETGFVGARTSECEYRWADGAYDRLPSLTNDLLSLRVNVIVPFGTSAIRAAKVVHATSSATEISIVFAAGNDPVADGIVASLNRPGGNITGITSIASELGSKRLGLLRELLPDIRTISLQAVVLVVRAFIAHPARSRFSTLRNLMTVAVAVHRDGNCGQLPFLKFICGPNATLRA